MATTTDNINIKINVDASKSEQSTVNYKAKIRELKEEMVQLQVETNGLADATAEQRARYDELQKQAGQLQDALSDVGARIRASADDYQNFNAVLEGAKGITAFGQGVAGVTSLLGINNDAVTKSIQVMMSLQSIMSSLNAVQQLFNKDSKVMIALEKLKVAAMGEDKAATVGATTATAAFAAGEGVATTASFTLAGACKAVGVAIKSIPVIGWILAAVAALATLISLISNANKESDNGNKVSEETVKLKTKLVEENQKRISALRDIEKEAERIKEHYKEIAGYIKEGNVNLLKYTDSVNEAAAALGVSKEFVEENRDSIDGWLESSAELAEYQKLLAENEKYYNEQLNERNALVEDVTTIYNSSWETGLALIDKAKEKYHLTDEEVTKISRTLNDVKNLNGDQEQAITDINTHLSTTLSIYDQEISKIQKVIEPQKEKVKNEKEFLDAIKQEGFEYDEQKKREEERKKRAEKWRTDRKAAQTEYVKQVEDMAIADAEYDKDYDRLLEERKKKVNRLYDEDKKKYDEQLKQKLISREQYDTLTKALQEKLNNDITELETDNDKRIWDEKVKNLDKDSVTYWDDYIKLLKEGLEKGFATEKELKDANREITEKEDTEAAQRLVNKYEKEAKEQEVARAKGRVAGLEEGTPEYFDALIALSEAQRELELEQLEQDKEAKLLSEEDYQIRKKEIIDRYNTENYEASKVAAEKEIKVKEDTLNVIGSMIQNLNTFTNQLMEIELESVGDNEKKKKEVRKKYATAQAMMQIAQIAIDQAMAAIGVWASVSDIPFPGNVIAGGVLSALVAAVGIASTVQAIQNKNKIMKAARGAYVVGPSHAEGGVPYELEGGEAVLNKRAMSIPAYRNMASAMNVATGGVAFPGTNPNMGMTAQVDRNTLRAIVQETVAGITAIPVVVSEESITNAQRNVGVSVERSRI